MLRLALLLLLASAAASAGFGNVVPPAADHQQQQQQSLSEMRQAIVVNQLVLQQLHEAVHKNELSCPYPYKLVLGECFFVSKKKLSWYKAREHCVGMNGDLATPKYLHALDSHAIISEGVSDYWTGARKQDNGIWRWLNGEIVDDQDWYDTLPGARPIADCLYIHAQAVVNQGPIANFNCNSPLRFICQLKSPA